MNTKYADHTNQIITNHSLLSHCDLPKLFLLVPVYQSASNVASRARLSHYRVPVGPVPVNRCNVLWVDHWCEVSYSLLRLWPLIRGVVICVECGTFLCVWMWYVFSKVLCVYKCISAYQVLLLALRLVIRGLLLQLRDARLEARGLLLQLRGAARGIL